MANKRPDEDMDEEEVKVKRIKLTSDELLVDVTILYLVVLWCVYFCRSSHSDKDHEEEETIQEVQDNE